MIATVTSKGQITVPGPVRDQLGIRPGSKLDFSIGADGRLEVEVINGSIWDLKGLSSKPGSVLTVEEMNAVIARAAAGE